MTRLTLTLLLATLAASPALAQDTFTERLQREMEGQGIVVLHHDSEVDALVNGRRRRAGKATPATPATATPTAPSSPASPPAAGTATGPKVRMNGYRIQVYVGGNSRDAKAKAQQMENRVLTLYPLLPTYTRFVSPRWICHVGDFKTREEAIELLTELRNAGGFDEAIVVKCKINATPD